MMMEKLDYYRYIIGIIEIGDRTTSAQELNRIFDKSTNSKAKTALEEWVERVRKRRDAFSRWKNKFDDGFANHLSGDVELVKVKIKDVWKSSEEWIYRGIEGQGGHWLNEFIIVRNVIPPPLVSKVADIPLDTPFRARIDIKSLKGRLFPKREISSMFPRNWSKERIIEEVAWVYESTVAKNRGLNPDSVGKKIKQYKYKDSSNTFNILIEVDSIDNIVNTYPLIG